MREEGTRFAERIFAKCPLSETHAPLSLRKIPVQGGENNEELCQVRHEALGPRRFSGDPTELAGHSVLVPLFRDPPRWGTLTLPDWNARKEEGSKLRSFIDL